MKHLGAVDYAMFFTSLQQKSGITQSDENASE